MTFRVGMKVVCIKAPDPNILWVGKYPSVLGRVYTIRETYISFKTNDLGLRFEEHVNPIDEYWQCEPGYKAERFRPIVEKKTDISFAHEILRKIGGKVDA